MNWQLTKEEIQRLIKKWEKFVVEKIHIKTECHLFPINFLIKMKRFFEKMTAGSTGKTEDS